MNLASFHIMQRLTKKACHRRCAVKHAMIKGRIQPIRKKGGPSVKHVEYEVIGMRCIGCSLGIQKLLKKQKAIDNVEVVLHESKLKIAYDESAIDDETIVKTVGRLGYKAVRIES
ncbi:MAG: heavy-metal-associated domain-containing protein [Acholeplasmatales bacterium]|nr:MAG: heavy-metal-associated domain-containing protein [Acholeplasmatales bacterium]